VWSGREGSQEARQEGIMQEVQKGRCLMARMPRIHNYKRTVVDNIKFHSKREAKRYQELKLAQKAGEVVFFLRQIRFDLPGNTKYYADFLVFWSDGSASIEDVKGHKTDTYIIKKRMVEELYPIKITEI